ncbi:MAG: hypothetical protein HY303_15075 [Candidatus Wallbacteria bacterium]|nr:hypothetical protein [Candidatus Wallbacteria bacterium]
MSEEAASSEVRSPRKPPLKPAGGLFAPARDRYGVRLALVFGNHAPEGRCPWFSAGKCHHCDIGAGEGAAFDEETHRSRLAFFRKRYSKVFPRLNHLVLYVSGSVLNPVELPPGLLDELLAFARKLPELRAVSLESRESFITEARVRRLANLLAEGQALRVALGLESADDRVRNGVLEKKMPEAAVRRALEELGRAARAESPGRVGLDLNVVVAGPGTSGATAAADAAATARYAFCAGRELGFPVDLNIHPYYPSARGLARFPDRPRCAPAALAAAVLAVDVERRALAPASGLFIGLEDEGHDREPGRRSDERRLAYAAIERFNETGDPRALEALLPPEPLAEL